MRISSAWGRVWVTSPLVSVGSHNSDILLSTRWVAKFAHLGPKNFRQVTGRSTLEEISCEISSHIFFSNDASMMVSTPSCSWRQVKVALGGSVDRAARGRQFGGNGSRGHRPGAEISRLCFWGTLKLFQVLVKTIIRNANDARVTKTRTSPTRRPATTTSRGSSDRAARARQFGGTSSRGHRLGAEITRLCSWGTFKCFKV